MSRSGVGCNQRTLLQCDGGTKLEGGGVGSPNSIGLAKKSRNKDGENHVIAILLATDHTDCIFYFDRYRRK